MVAKEPDGLDEAGESQGDGVVPLPETAPDLATAEPETPEPQTPEPEAVKAETTGETTGEIPVVAPNTDAADAPEPPDEPAIPDKPESSESSESPDASESSAESPSESSADVAESPTGAAEDLAAGDQADAPDQVDAPEESQTAVIDAVAQGPAETAEVAAVEESPAETAVLAAVAEPVAESTAAPVPPKRSWLALWSVVLSVLGLGVLPVIGSVLGLVLGRIALRRGPGYRVIGGRPLAMVGFWLGTVTLVVIAVAVATYALVTAFAAR